MSLILNQTYPNWINRFKFTWTIFHLVILLSSCWKFATRTVCCHSCHKPPFIFFCKNWKILRAYDQPPLVLWGCFRVGVFFGWFSWQIYKYLLLVLVTIKWCIHPWNCCTRSSSFCNTLNLYIITQKYWNCSLRYMRIHLYLIGLFFLRFT